MSTLYFVAIKWTVWLFSFSQVLSARKVRMPHARCLFCWRWILFARVFTTNSLSQYCPVHVDTCRHKYAVDWPATGDGPTLVLTRALHSVPSHGLNTGWFSITYCFLFEEDPGAVICYLVLRGLGQLFKKFAKYPLGICIFVSYFSYISFILYQPIVSWASLVFLPPLPLWHSVLRCFANP